MEQAKNVPENKHHTPKYYVSELTGNKYSYKEYINHGRGKNVLVRGLKDLPNEYPYKIEYESLKEV